MKTLIPAHGPIHNVAKLTFRCPWGFLDGVQGKLWEVMGGSGGGDGAGDPAGAFGGPGMIPGRLFGGSWGSWELWESETCVGIVRILHCTRKSIKNLREFQLYDLGWASGLDLVTKEQ